jgi:dolichol-phosphate mannosyltransferase
MNTIIVIPTYNEKNNILPLIKEIINVKPDAKILIVDDNSPDGTGNIVDQLCNEFHQIAVLHRKKKEGLGKAYIAAFKEALKYNPDYIIQMDADFSHKPEYIPLLLKDIAYYDIVSGSRYLFDKRPKNTTFLSFLASQYVKLVLGSEISDLLGGFKCFRRRVIEDIGLDRFISSGFVFQAEFMYRAVKRKFSIKEIPIYFHNRFSGKSKKSAIIIFEAFFKVLLLRMLSFINY